MNKLASAVSALENRFRGSLRGTGDDEKTWNCEGCSELIMIVETLTGTYRHQIKAWNIRVTPAKGTQIKIVCNNCGRENMRLT